MRRLLSLLRAHWAGLAVAVGIVAFGYSLCIRGIILSDEGYLLLQALDLRDGKLLYRDMDAFVTPGIWFLLAGLFSVLEPSVITSRLLALAGYVGMVAVSYRAVAKLASPGYAFCAVGFLMVFTVWAFPAWTFAFYSPFSVLFALAALERLAVWRAGRRRRDLLWVGAMLGLSIAFKQNYGAFALIGALVGLLAIELEAADATPASALRKGFADALWVAPGIAAIGVPLVGYFAAHGALSPLFNSLVLHPLEFGGRHDIPYVPLWHLFAPEILDDIDRLTYGAYALNNSPQPFSWSYSVRAVERLHVVLYWAPVLVFLGGALLALRPLRSGGRPDGTLVATLAVCGGVFLGVFPRADFNHLINVYQPVIVAGAVVAHRLSRALPAPRPTWAGVAIGLFWTIFALHAAMAVYWYNFIQRTMQTEIAFRRGGVYVNAQVAYSIASQVGAILRESRTGDAVLTIPDLAMLNFLAERPMPSRYYNLYEHHIMHDGGAGVVAGARKWHVDLAVTRYENFFSDRVGLRDYAPVLTDYLDTDFEILYTASNDTIIFLKRRKEPLRSRPSIEVLTDCDVEPKTRDKRAVRSHLLFTTLYHFLGDGSKKPELELETRCELELPKDASELVLGFDYRRPVDAERGTRIVGRIRLEHADGTTLLHDEEIPVIPRTTWSVPPPKEYRFDVSAWAGQRVALRFESTRRGRVAVRPLDFKGFAMFWQDARVELAPPETASTPQRRAARESGGAPD